jgi:hypothetical protein
MKMDPPPQVEDLVEWAGLDPEQVTLNAETRKFLTRIEDTAREAPTLRDAIWNSSGLVDLYSIDEQYDLYYHLGWAPGLTRDQINLISANIIHDALETVTYNLSDTVFESKQLPIHLRPRLAIVHPGTGLVVPDITELLIVDLNAVEDPETEEIDWAMVEMIGQTFHYRTD